MSTFKLFAMATLLAGLSHTPVHAIGNDDMAPQRMSERDKPTEVQWTGTFRSTGNTGEGEHEHEFICDLDGKSYEVIRSPKLLELHRTGEKDLHILYRLTWFGTPSDVSREVDDGRGPADFKISRGARDKTIVEFKLASNKKLKQNLAKQAEIYQKASDARGAVKVIVYFTAAQLERVNGILASLGLTGHPDVVLIDARADNKPSGSVAA